MPKSLKIILCAVGGFFALLACIAVAVYYFVDANKYKPGLEAAASKALGMEVKVGGRLRIALFPGLLVKLEDVHIQNRGADFASAKEAGLKINLLPLLRKEVRIGKINLDQPMISVVRDRDGRYNFENMESAARRSSGLDSMKFTFADLKLEYTDEQTGFGFEAGDCSLAVPRLQLSRGEISDLMQNLTLQAELTCGEIRTKDFLAASDLRFSVAGRKGVFDLKPVSLRLFGGKGTGSIRADFTGAVPQYQVGFTLVQFQIEEFFKTMSPNKVAHGSMDFATNLSIRGKTTKATWTADGEASLRGANLVFDNMDLDQMLSRIESSQNFNLVDVGAIFIAGPLGLVVTKGYNFASILQESGGRSEIRLLVSNWKVGDGVALARDVAMATEENRIALQGGLDFVNQRFNEVTVAVIDAEGCATVQQQIHGAFRKPVVEKPNILRSMTRPALNLLKEGIDLLPDTECEVFYSGSVAPPQ
jgi:AsmA protein